MRLIPLNPMVPGQTAGRLAGRWPGRPGWPNPRLTSQARRPPAPGGGRPAAGPAVPQGPEDQRHGHCPSCQRPAEAIARGPCGSTSATSSPGWTPALARWPPGPAPAPASAPRLVACPITSAGCDGDCPPGPGSVPGEGQGPGSAGRSAPKQVAGAAGPSGRRPMTLKGRRQALPRRSAPAPTAVRPGLSLGRFVPGRLGLDHQHPLTLLTQRAEVEVLDRAGRQRPTVAHPGQEVQRLFEGHQVHCLVEEAPARASRPWSCRIQP